MTHVPRCFWCDELVTYQYDPDETERVVRGMAASP